MIDVVLFRLHRLMADVATPMAIAIDAALQRVNAAPLGLDYAASHVRDGARSALRLAMTQARVSERGEPERWHAFQQDFAQALRSLPEDPEAVPIADMLDRLRSADAQAVLLTNIERPLAHAVMTQRGWTDAFDLLLARESDGETPIDARPVGELLRQLHATPERTLAVGVDAQDVRLARGAGIGVQCASAAMTRRRFGQMPAMLDGDEPPDAWFDSFAEFDPKVDRRMSIF